MFICTGVLSLFEGAVENELLRGESRKKVDHFNFCKHFFTAFILFPAEDRL